MIIEQVFKERTYVGAAICENNGTNTTAISSSQWRPPVISRLVNEWFTQGLEGGTQEAIFAVVFAT